MTRLVLATVLLFLAACSAATRYTVQVDVFKGQLSFEIPDVPFQGVFPEPAGQPVRLFVSPDILERAEISIKVSLENTSDSTPLSGSYEIRLAPENDTDLTDNAGGDVGLGRTSFNVPAGQKQPISTTVSLSASENSTAFNIIKSGSFRIAIRVEVNSSGGGRFELTEAQVKVTGRPFALIK